MKCPKCLYIGFETGDRCKNCGYEFSLLAVADEASTAPADLPLRGEPAESPAFDVSSAVEDAWTAPSVDRFRDLPDEAEPALALSLAGPEPEIAPSPAPAVSTAPSDVLVPTEPALPLFEPDMLDDEPLVKLPAVPRVPLSVRKTPDTPRLRQASPFGQPRLPEDAVLQFVEEPQDGEEVSAANVPAAAMEAEPGPEPRMRLPRGPRFLADAFARADQAQDAEPAASPFGRRVAAAVIDHGILLGIDFVVLYFTLRLTELSLADWRLLPMLPLAAFLLLLKVAYLSAFTTAGGQTIGKMATHIRVVSDDGGRLDPGRALRRAVLGLASIATVGAPFLTALSDPARRGVHDRASGTRVVALAPR
jgi:uncharacterized RDD family membrane protein YckC